MRLAKLEQSLVNKRLAFSINSKDGQKLIDEGAILTTRLIDQLKEEGICAVYIEDNNYDVELHETVEKDKKLKLLRTLDQIYFKIRRNEFNQQQFLRFIRYEFLPGIKNEPVSIPADEIMEKDDILRHSLNVAILAVRTAYNLKLSTDRIVLVAFTALMHDIGKLLLKDNPRLMGSPHYELAYQFLKNKNCSVLAYMSVRFQTESYDGKGAYQIDNEKQLDIAKILTICNYYETLLRTGGLMPYECFEKTQALVNIKFDPVIFQAFREALYIYPVGLPVYLNNKTVGIIVRQNKSYPLRPIVKIDDQYFNLMENLSLFIENVAI